MLRLLSVGRLARSMLSRLTSIGLMCGVGCVNQGTAQSFEAASVKRSKGPQGFCQGGPQSRDPGQFACTATLKDLALWAFGGENFQIDGPKWMDSEADLYEVRVKIAAGTKYPDFEIMLQDLLVQRFHLQYHRERREFPAWDVVVAKGGAKFKESTDEFAQKPDYPALGPSGIGSRGVGRTGRRIAAHNATMGRLLTAVGGFSGRPIIDKTGLTGKYDMWLEFDGRAMMFPDYAADLPALNVAMEQQLGLKFVDARAPFDIVVVDHVEKEPTEN
jgi:uncharacterized protein (TIGR03435 family)